MTLSSIPGLLQEAIGHQRAGRLPQAEALYRQVLALSPDHPDALHLLGTLALQASRPDMAIPLIERAIALRPAAPMFCNLGIALRALGRYEEAAGQFRRAIALEPGNVLAHAWLGQTLQQGLGQPAAAVASYRQALALKPDHVEVHNNLGMALKDLGQLDDAVAHFRAAIALRPDWLEVRSNLLLVLSFHPGCTPAEYLAEARAYGALAASRAKPYTHWLTAAPGAGRGPLRVGMVSGDLQNHPVGYFLEAILPHIDRSRIALHAYPTKLQADELTGRIRPLFAGWNPIAGMSDEQAARRIHDDGIDLLLDLAGHTAWNRLPLFAWKPAPVQASWLGYFASTGVAAIDFLVTDRTSVPDAARAFFSEQLWYLPETRLCFAPPRPAPEPSALPALHNGFVTFGSFQGMAKIRDEVLALWARVLRAVPGARLRLQNKEAADPQMQQQLLEKLERLGVERERVALAGPTDRAHYLAAYAAVDIVLDTFPYPGGATTCEGLWMGVPTLTLAGNTLLARQGASLLDAAGLPAWIARDEDDYVARAARLAADTAALAQLRASLRDRLPASPLMDARRFAGHLESALLGMASRQCPDPTSSMPGVTS